MRLIPFSAEHLNGLEWQEAQANHKHWQNPEWAEDIERLSTAWTGLDDEGQIIGVAGFTPTKEMITQDGTRIPVESHAWAIFSPLMPKHAGYIVSFIRRVLNMRSEKRIEAYIFPEHAKAASFAERLGFRFEKAVSGLHPEGHDLWLYARVRD